MTGTAGQSRAPPAAVSVTVCNEFSPFGPRTSEMSMLATVERSPRASEGRQVRGAHPFLLSRGQDGFLTFSLSSGPLLCSRCSRACLCHSSFWIPSPRTWVDLGSCQLWSLRFLPGSLCGPWWAMNELLHLVMAFSNNEA